MRYSYALTLLLALGLSHSAYAQQPFLKYGVRVKVATLSNGRFQEFFTNDSLRRIGSAVYDTRLHRVAYLLPADSLVGHAKPDITSRWLSPDPLAEKFMYESPYIFVSNNPLNKFDPDGRSGIAAIDAKNHTVTITSHIVFYGNAGTSAMANTIANGIQNQWNGANGTAKIGGETYKVRFVVTGEYRADLGNQEIKDNKDASNNYVLLQDEKPSYYEHSHFGGNDGVFWTREMSDGSNTASHEYGHGVEGPKHLYNGRALDRGHPTNNHAEVDARGMKGRPGIMWPRGTQVESQYQRDPSAPSGYGVGGLINPSQRAANQSDIDFMDLGSLKYNSAGQATVGQISPDPHIQRDPAVK